jgi:hypothetical protein
MAEASGDDVFDTAAFDCGTFKAVSEMEHHYEMEHLKETNSLEEYELFTNGLGLNLQQEERFDSVIETRKRCKKFHEGGTWVPITNFSALPYLCVKPRHGRPHHFADVVEVNKVIDIELGYDHVIDYIEIVAGPSQERVATSLVTLFSIESWRLQLLHSQVTSKVPQRLGTFTQWWRISSVGSRVMH